MARWRQYFEAHVAQAIAAEREFMTEVVGQGSVSSGISCARRSSSSSMPSSDTSRMDRQASVERPVR